MISLTLRRLRNRARDFVHTHRVRRMLDRNHGIRRVREFHRPHWHLGSRYYAGVQAQTGTSVFVKLGTRDMVVNETIAWRRIADGTGTAFLARLVANDDAGPFPFTAFEWIAGGSLAELLERGDAAALAGAADDLLRLVDVLYGAQVVHRDIRPANLLLRPNAVQGPALVLIDFAFAVIDQHAATDVAVPREALLTLGGGLNPAPLTWDDAYSALMIVRQMERAAGRAFDASNQLERRVGRLVHAGIVTA